MIEHEAITHAVNRNGIDVGVGNTVKCTDDCLSRGIGFPGYGEVKKIYDAGGYIIAVVGFSTVFEEMHIDWLES